jgi:8-oxo-dGTP diphosphatase
MLNQEREKIRLVTADTIKKLFAVLKPVSQEQDANAAVTLLLKPRRGDFEVLLVKRVENPQDPWSGQMALPGGKREPDDEDLKGTVKRETMEEVGVALADSSFLGVLTAVKSEHKPEVKILPFVALLADEPKLELCREELESYVWVPYENIVKSRGTVEFTFGKYPAYMVADPAVWGITYRILSQFVQTVENAARL